MVLRLIDGNNVFRRTLESDPTASPTRNWVAEMSGYAERGDYIIIVWDPPNALKRRRDIVPHYKAKRPALTEDLTLSMKLAKDVLAVSGVLQIEVPTYEADDVIAALHAPGCIIHSSDRDFLQLEGITLYPDPGPLTTPTRWVRVMKASLGDPSDNLKGIKGFGKKSWDAFSDDQRSRLESVLLGNLPDILKDDLSKASYSWLEKEENLATIRAEYEVAGFIPVPEHQLVDGLRHPTKDSPRAARLLQEFMQ